MRFSRWLKRHPMVIKIGTIIIAAVMVLSLMIPAMAFAENGENYKYDGTPSITILGSKDDGKIYVAYQIFAGKASAEDESSADKTQLTSVDFGEAINDDVKVDLQEMLGATSSVFTPADLLGVAEAQDMSNKTRFAYSMAKSCYENAQLTGHQFKSENGENAFLKLDKYGVSSSNVDKGIGLWVVAELKDNRIYADTATFVKVMDDAEISMTNPEPTISQHVFEDSTSLYSSYADAAIGDTVKFRLNSNMSNNAKDYKGDYLIDITSELSDGLVFTNKDKTEDSVTVMVNGNEIDRVSKNSEGTSTENYKIEYRGDTIEIHLCNSNFNKMMAGDDIVVDYTATVDKTIEAAPGYASVNATLTYTSNPENTDTKTVHQSSSTRVFTYDVEASLVNTKGEALSDAAFTLGTRDGWLTCEETDKGVYVVTGISDGPDSASKVWVAEDGTFVVKGLDFDSQGNNGSAFQIRQVEVTDKYAPIAEDAVIKFTTTLENPNGDNVKVKFDGAGGADGDFEYSGNVVKIGNDIYKDPNAIGPQHIIGLIITVAIIVAAVIGIRKFIAWRRDQYDYDDDWDDDDF